MPMHRSNKAPAVLADNEREAWFIANKKRQRARKKMAKKSKQRNRA